MNEENMAEQFQEACKILQSGGNAAISEFVASAAIEIATLRSVMRADDERLSKAAKRVWGEDAHGCDTAECMADLILELREQNRLLKDYATYRGLESNEGLSFSAWVAEHFQPRVAVGEKEGGT